MVAHALGNVCFVLVPNFPIGHSCFHLGFGQYAPFGHVAHSVDPSDRAVVPIGHDCFDVAFEQYAPFGHIVPVDPTDIAMVPSGQSLHTDGTVCPVSFPYFPKGQNCFDVAFGQYAPFGHMVHSVDPEDKAMVPRRHDLHADGPVSPVSFPYFPKGHKCPGAAFGQYASFGHMIHSFDPNVRVVVPRRHELHRQPRFVSILSQRTRRCQPFRSWAVVTHRSKPPK